MNQYDTNEDRIVRDAVDVKCLRTMTGMITGLFGLFLALIFVARMIGQ